MLFCSSFVHIVSAKLGIASTGSNKVKLITLHRYGSGFEPVTQ